MRYWFSAAIAPSLGHSESRDDRVYVRSLTLAIACEIHPLTNLRVLKFVTGGLGLTEEDKMRWIRHWAGTGSAALKQELSLSGKRGRFCFGDAPTIADCCLVPQLFNAQRFGIDLMPYPTLMAINEECAKLPEFEHAHPSRQPDAE